MPYSGMNKNGSYLPTSKSRAFNFRNLVSFRQTKVAKELTYLDSRLYHWEKTLSLRKRATETMFWN